jgi:hypothetical protein
LIFDGQAYESGRNPRLAAAGAAAFRVPVEAIAGYRGSADPMADPALVPQVIGLWSIVHGFADLMLLGQLEGQPGVTRRTLIDELMPRMIRFFGKPHAPDRRGRTPRRRG